MPAPGGKARGFVDGVGPIFAAANSQGGEQNALMSLAFLQYLTGRPLVPPSGPSAGSEPSE